MKYAPEELLHQVNTLLAKDRARLAGMKAPIYTGPNMASKSSMTQKADALAKQYGSKASPYTNKINKVVGRTNQGFSQQQQQDLLNMLQSGQYDFTDKKSLKRLQKEFGETHKGREGKFINRAQKDVSRGLGEAQTGLKNLSSEASRLQNKDSKRQFDLLKALQAEKVGRRDTLMGNLREFGNQEHAYQNLKIDANKDQFEQEKKWPYERMNLLAKSTEPLNRALQAGQGTIHPDLAGPMTQELAESLRAYGVDPSSDPTTWDTSRMTNAPQYPGERVAPQTQEWIASQKLLEQIDPKIKDTFSDQRKGLVKGLVNRDPTAEAIANLPPEMQSYVKSLENDAKQRMKKEQKIIGNKYIQNRQYGSNAHMAEVERRMRDINKAVFEQRNKILQGALTNQLGQGYQKNINDLTQAANMGVAGNQEYTDIMKDLRSMNRRGTDMWNNDQTNADTLYNNYNNQRMWDWPHMRQQSQNQALQNFAGQYNMSLQALQNILSPYSNTQNAPITTPQNTIQTTPQYWQQKPITIQQTTPPPPQPKPVVNNNQGNAASWWRKKNSGQTNVQPNTNSRGYISWTGLAPTSIGRPLHSYGHRTINFSDIPSNITTRRQFEQHFKLDPGGSLSGNFLSPNQQQRWDQIWYS